MSYCGDGIAYDVLRGLQIRRTLRGVDSLGGTRGLQTRQTTGKRLILFIRGMYTCMFELCINTFRKNPKARRALVVFGLHGSG